MLSPNPTRSIVVYTIIIMVLFCVPSYFAIQSTISEQKYKATQEIVEWVETHEATIFAHERFEVPKSVRFHINIYNEMEYIVHRFKTFY